MIHGTLIFLVHFCCKHTQRVCHRDRQLVKYFIKSKICTVTHLRTMFNQLGTSTGRTSKHWNNFAAQGQKLLTICNTHLKQNLLQSSENAAFGLSNWNNFPAQCRWVLLIYNTHLKQDLLHSSCRICNTTCIQFFGWKRRKLKGRKRNWFNNMSLLLLIWIDFLNITTWAFLWTNDWLCQLHFLNITSTVGMGMSTTSHKSFFNPNWYQEKCRLEFYMMESGLLH